MQIEPLSSIELKPHKYIPKDARQMYAAHNIGRFQTEALQRSYPLVSLKKLEDSMSLKNAWEKKRKTFK